jgi:redox-sensitive bicupin YhaK (pirin superfamily)
MGQLDAGFSTSYTLHRKGNGVYAFVIEGDVTINGQKLNRRDGLGIKETDSIEVIADSDAKILLMEVPV